jgi:hypothetical protein
MSLQNTIDKKSIIELFNHSIFHNFKTPKKAPSGAFLNQDKKIKELALHHASRFVPTGVPPLYYARQ